MIFEKNIVITVDGYSSCGKSTFARSLAEKLGYIYIDSGAMYRAVTFLCMEKGMEISDKIDIDRLEELIREIDIQFKYNELAKKTEIFLNGANIEKEIRSIEVANKVSIISKMAIVREKLVSIQRSLGENKRIVMDGRDIGTVVFPNAEVKIFMTADIDIRTERRFKELSVTMNDISFEEVRKNLINRDKIDTSRKVSPLKMPKDAILLDNSHLTIDEQLDWGLNLIKEKYNSEINDCRN